MALILSLSGEASSSENMFLTASSPPSPKSSESLFSAKQNLPFPITDSHIEENLKILPIPENGKYTYHLVYVVHLSTKNNLLIVD